VKLAAVIIAFAVVALAAAMASAQSLADRDRTSVAALEQTLIDAIASAEPSVVAISRIAPRQPPAIEQRLGDVFGPLRQAADQNVPPPVVAAGVIIDPAGYVLTEFLAVREGEQHTVTTIDGKRHPATIRAADPRSGLAVLALEADTKAAGDRFPAIRFAEDAPLRKGQLVIAIGNPFAIARDAQPTASWGIITNLARKAPAGTNLNDAAGPYNDHRTTLHHLGTLIQTDAKLGWNAGGGALINMRGELLGLTTSVSAIAGHEQPAGYAIPTGSEFRRVIDTLKEGREVEYGMLGVGFGQLPLESTSAVGSSLNVTQVYPGGPAARAGIEPNDSLIRVGDREIKDVDDVQLAISALPPATTTTIAYERGGRTATTTVTLAKLAVAGKRIATVRPDSWQGLRVDYATALEAAEIAQAISSGIYDPEGCVLVVEVEPDSVAWRAGVRPGMFISHLAGKRVTSPAEFHSTVRNVGDEFDIRLTKPSMPADPKLDAND
jgi:serine protease Do